MLINIYKLVRHCMTLPLEYNEIAEAVDAEAACITTGFKLSTANRNTIIDGLFAIMDNGYSQPKEYRYQLETHLGEASEFPLWFDLSAKDRLVVYAGIESWSFFFGGFDEYDITEFIDRFLREVATHSEQRWSDTSA